MFPIRIMKKAVISFLLVLSSALSCEIAAQNQSSPPMTIIYVFDPLCGWCYGFSGVIQDFVTQHPELEVEIISGGMVTGDRIGPLSEIAPYLRTAYKGVEERTGVVFGEPYLKELFGEATMEMTSVPSSRALATFKQLNDDQRAAFAYGSALQKAIYFDGVAPGNVEIFADLATEFGIDRDLFLSTYRSDAIEKAMLGEFAKSDALGVNGFPTVLLVKDNSVTPLSRGYVNLEALEKSFGAVTK